MPRGRWTCWGRSTQWLKDGHPRCPSTEADTGPEVFPRRRGFYNGSVLPWPPTTGRDGEQQRSARGGAVTVDDDGWWAVKVCGYIKRLPLQLDSQRA